VQKETKPKVKISFFKDFTVKFPKRENIDKKVLRKFRKFLKDNNKKSQAKFQENNSGVNSFKTTSFPP